MRSWGCAVLALVLAAHPALALDPSGTAVAVVRATSATGPGGDRVLEDEKPVYSGDSITTDAIGRAQILFRDDTRLVVGPNSSLKIDKFVYSKDGNATAVAMNMTKGALRFISGNSPSNVYKIKTPTASIGVRGTQFDVAIGSRGETGLLLFQGAVQMCSAANRCITVQEACGAALALTNGAVGPITSQVNRAARLRARFPLVGNQSRLRPDFRVNAAGCGGVDASRGDVGPADSGDMGAGATSSGESFSTETESRDGGGQGGGGQGGNSEVD